MLIIVHNVTFKVVLSAYGDWQLEVRLLSYNNPRGLTADMLCCDTQVVNCASSDICDTEIAVRIQNFDRLNAPLGTLLLVGVYHDTNFITFPSCGVLEGGNSNPLVITFPTTDFGIGVS